MEYGLIDSSGTDDDNPQIVYNRGTVGGRVAGNGRSFLPSAPFQRIQIDMEYEIHNLEQIAYGAVLRAFKAQSDALTWEKEGLITELRKELRVSDDEHRELLSQVNGDDLIRRIREWREAGGNRNVAPNVPQHINNQLPSPTVSASRKRQKTSLSGNPFNAHSQALLSQPVAGSTLPLNSVVKRGPSSGIGGRRPNVGQPAFTSGKPMQYQFGDHVSSGAPMDDPSESIHESLIGRRVMIRWPADSNFYEAVISEYNPVDGRHSLVYDSNLPSETVEWVNIKEVPPEDIRWVGEDPVVSRLGDTGGPNPGRGRTTLMNQYANEMRPSRNGAVKEDSEEIEILHTDTLIKKVEKVLEASHPDASEIDKAKKMLKEHEQTLVQVIQKLVDACDSDDEQQQQTTDYRGRGNELEIAGRAGSYELARG
ncbi:protein EMSY-LIKE 1-like isoform X3 [Salvia miltiorrhiza]|uniref:protein EMSY-LIKE 1-like isoform X3 n=1 Tax=Salvia miltiorrhiza TaxID=226208 RepID=UPI0025ACF262|nr:protein EMSY-LIKE 1-like isoform X3 [Salvia miltiorrhiza]